MDDVDDFVDVDIAYESEYDEPEESSKYWAYDIEDMCTKPQFIRSEMYQHLSASGLLIINFFI